MHTVRFRAQYSDHLGRFWSEGFCLNEATVCDVGSRRFRFRRLPFLDRFNTNKTASKGDQRLSQSFHRAVKFVGSKDEKVLLHCCLERFRTKTRVTQTLVPKQLNNFSDLSKARRTLPSIILPLFLMNLY
jgi:hypothetical protein